LTSQNASDSARIALTSHGASLILRNADHAAISV
jgi:hypothetical protein